MTSADTVSVKPACCGRVRNDIFVFVAQFTEFLAERGLSPAFLEFWMSSPSQKLTCYGAKEFDLAFGTRMNSGHDQSLSR